MTRLAAGRDTHLTRAEIAAEALRQFDAGHEPSVRGLATALKVAPTTIYHHFASRAEIVDAALALVWQEAGAEGFALLPDPLNADPAEVLVIAGLAVRRAFTRHDRLAQHLAATPESSRQFTQGTALMANALERLGLAGEEAGSAFHAYGAFTIGSVLFAAARRNADAAKAEHPVPERDLAPIVASGLAGEATIRALDEAIDYAVTDPARDEELFVAGLRRLVAGLTSASA
jgi:AcrR family transcriptional regulator